MKISVKAKPNSNEYKVDPPSLDGFGEAKKNYYEVSVKEPPVRGQANEAIIRTLADYFGVSRSHVRIVSGWTSRNKVIEIAGV